MTFLKEPVLGPILGERLPSHYRSMICERADGGSNFMRGAQPAGVS